MATISSTRPPTSGEVSGATEGEGSSDVPMVDVVDWAHAIPLPETVGPAASLPLIESEFQDLPPPVGLEEEDPGPPAAPAPASPPSAALAFDEHPVAVARSMEMYGPTLLPPPEDYGPSIIVDPKQITAHSSAQSLPGTKTPPPGTPLPVLLLVDQAQKASGAERQELSRRINRWLDQMVREGGSRHVADWFHHLIEGGRLEGLADSAGHSCHETAVRGLLSMGFPYALEIRPEDLERLKPRELQKRSKKRDRNLKGGAAGILVGGAITELVLNLLRFRPATGLVTVEVGIALLAMVALLFSGPKSDLRKMALAVLLVGSVLSISLGLFIGYTGVVTGLAGLVAALLFALHRS
ncbi:hypothetical protein [Hyalangium sp.]|uniref:hypothetical protein n=1 Tax=Hyalangium sp. TaxID=2028555 RepID=UPI002D6DA245|nr:hypothetical protein [Hyalangium sp.]HYH95131.1 hypothetical protein [Hyalangium sp.]